jgi:DNA-directed RNA polymerase specialized sigma24 family protein
VNRSVAWKTGPTRQQPLGLACQADLEHLLHEAESAARRLVRNLRLPAHEREDIRQELLLDLIVRLKWFDPARGSVGAFANTILAHRGARIAARVQRERAIFVSTLPSHSVVIRSTNHVRGGHSDAELPNLVQSPTPFATAGVDLRLDLQRALNAMEPADSRLCAELVDENPTEISRSGKGSRAGLYRRIREIRLRMMLAGVSVA